MEFELCTVQCVDSSLELEQEEEDTLSLRGLVTENGGVSMKWESSSTNHHDAFFEFALSNSTAYKFCPAEELFHQGRLLPLHAETRRTPSNQHFLCGKSKSQHENRRLLQEKLDAWRTDSLDTQSGCRSSFISINSQASQKKGIQSFYETCLWRSQSTFHPDRTSKRTHLAGKSRLKWLQFFTGSLITTPPMNLQDLRLKHGKPKSSNNYLQSSVFKRSVSANSEDLKSVNFQHRCMSVKESMRGKDSNRSKGWKFLTPVINCLSIQERGSGEEIGTAKKKLSEVDQNSVSSKNGGARVHPSPLVSPRKRSRWIFPKRFLQLV